jgi:hypothetical protein
VKTDVNVYAAPASSSMRRPDAAIGSKWRFVVTTKGFAYARKRTPSAWSSSIMPARSG